MPEEQARQGKQATSPTRYGWRDWMDVLRRVAGDIGQHHLSVLAAGVAFFAGAASLCPCGTGSGLMLIAANMLSWVVAVSGSYAMNSFVTFAAESGRQLRLKAYLTFLASGLIGLVGNTTTLVVAAQFVPVWLAKVLAIGVSFVINFSMSHFVVFPPSAKRF